MLFHCVIKKLPQLQMLLSRYVAILGCLRFYILIKAEISKELCFTKSLKHLAFTNVEPLHTTLKGMVWWNVLTAHCYNCSDVTLTQKMTGNVICYWYFMLIAQHNIPQLVYHHFNLCSGDHHNQLHFSNPLPLIQLPTLLTYKLNLPHYKI